MVAFPAETFLAKPLESQAGIPKPGVRTAIRQTVIHQSHFTSREPEQPGPGGAFPSAYEKGHPGCGFGEVFAIYLIAKPDFPTFCFAGLQAL